MGDPTVVRDIGHVIDEVALSASRRRSASLRRGGRGTSRIFMAARARQSST